MVLIREIPDHTTFRGKGHTPGWLDKIVFFLSLALCILANFDQLYISSKIEYEYGKKKQFTFAPCILKVFLKIKVCHEILGWFVCLSVTMVTADMYMALDPLNSTGRHGLFLNSTGDIRLF